MKPIVVVGAGKIGSMITDFLNGTGDYKVTLVDQNQDALDRIAEEIPGISTVKANASNQQEMEAAFKGHFAVINSCPFDISASIAHAAAAQQVHYLDLTEDVASTRLIKSLAKDAKSAFIPQCGLAPGFISIVAYDLARKFDSLHNVHMRVGALPKFPSNALKYNLTWSTDGLINEYLNPCEAIVNGQLREVPPMEELEHFSLDGDDYEAFNTSGGLGTLCETLEGKVSNLNYRTVRYPGHRDVMKLLLNDLRLGERRDLLKEIMESAIPVTMQDVVLVFANVSGVKNGLFLQETFARKIYSREINGKLRSAIQITTASGICAALDLLAEGKLPNQGFVRQEDIRFEDFINNRFGRNYMEDDGKHPSASVRRVA
ncbi:saccharopine dehydrogenase C-terminal domain-containing protein [Hahella aquimaris]|uniref:saccharopine dehydrogenase family protein n=1 Tax=Hahella sp. HNIBRBA332 TaxID=3015983 RepID=UPI00273C949F|nr:saccharopine dehydrogenase C-terminal domain-containing protein [Hahella sp. HNIBRBA332]WLQ11773.1 saccharopine dehydrogenase C-terminal domain-containing protein [Hahella sp. HNIBRBA332]